ncbi:hypothetical protein PV797_05530 [Clostridiaceae bacterium M8S5]|nr:hypothetical protein PV797_05530 [Clostridiaceae bacterium M8S5]
MNDSLILKISNALEHMNANSRNLSSLKKWTKKLRDINQSLNNTKLYDEINDVISSCEEAIATKDVYVREGIISTQYKKTKAIMKSILQDELSKLQRELEERNIEDFCIEKNNGYEVILKGSFDLSYYHELEIIFKDVQFMICPCQIFSVNNLRLATKEEIKNITNVSEGYETQGFVIVLEHTLWNEKYFIIANEVKTKWKTVKYYN